MIASNDNTPDHIRRAVVESLEWHWRHFYKVERLDLELQARRDWRTIQAMKERLKASLSRQS